MSPATGLSDVPRSVRQRMPCLVPGRNSPVMHPSVPEACCSVVAFPMWLLLMFQLQEFKPLLFQNGQKIPFPEPTKAGDER